MISGKLVGLTAVERVDLPLLKKWRNNPECRKYYREYRELSDDNQSAWYEKLVLADPNTLMFAIRDVNTNELLGCCGLCYINWVNRNADLSLYIGKDDAYIDDKGYAKEACELLFQYGFGELGLEKIWTEIYEFDEPKYKLYTELGMKQDGLLRKQYFHDGKWWNSRMMSILKDEWE